MLGPTKVAIIQLLWCLLIIFLRWLRRIEDLRVQLAVVADLERNLKANGSIDAKSLEDIGRKEEYEMELKSLEEEIAMK